MSYAEHGPRAFLAGKPEKNVYSIYGDYVAPQRRPEGRLKVYESCMDIRAWSSNQLEKTRYFHELHEHATTVPGKVVPFDVLMENMIGLTAQAQKKLRATQRELHKYKLLKLSPEQRRHLESLNKGERDCCTEQRETEEARIGSVIRPLLPQGTLLFHPDRLVYSRYPNTPAYPRLDNQFRYFGEIYNSLLASKPASKENRFTSSSSENETFLTSHVTSSDLLSERKATQERSNQASVCIEYVDASSQAEQTVCEVCVQTDECKDTRSIEIDGYAERETRRDVVDSFSSQFCGSSETASTSEFRMPADFETYEKNHRADIIEKDSEIIVLKNVIGVKEDELEELSKRLEERNESAELLRCNANILEKKLRILSDKHRHERDELNSKLSTSEGVVDQLREELRRKCQVCHLQSQDIQQLRKQLEDAELLSMENETLARKVKEIEYLSKEVESCGVPLEQVRSVWRERNILEERCREQNCMLADREDEIQRLLTLIKQMSVTANNREVEMNEMSKMNDIVADLRNEIGVKDEKIAQCEMQLDFMEREVGNLTSMLKSNLNNLDESKVAYESICEHARCEHDTCLDVQSALAALGTFIATLEERKRDRLQEIDNLRTCIACYSREAVSEIGNTDFYIEREATRPQVAEDASTSSDREDSRSSKKLVNVQIQSDEVETSTSCSDSSRLNQVISNEEIDRIFTTHFKQHISKMSAILQGAGDQHAQIVREHEKQRQEMRQKDLEIARLRERAECILRRGEGDCTMQEELRMREKENVLEVAMNERDSEVARLRECLGALEKRVCAYHEERDTLRSENAELIDGRDALAKENEACREELQIQGDQMRELTQQMDDFKLINEVLQKEVIDINGLKEKLMDLQTRNNDLTNKLVQASESIRRHTEIIADLKRQDEESRLALTREGIKYDAMITQKLDDIAKLRDENRSLRDLLNEAEIKLAHSNDTILLLRDENDSVAAINVLKTSLTALDDDKEKLLARADSLKNEIASCENSTARVASELLALSRQNEVLRADLETVKNTNDQLLRARENDSAKRPLKNALYTLPGKIYERIVRLRENDGADGSTKTTDHRSNEIILDADDDGYDQSAKTHADESCQQQDEEFDASQRTRDELDSVARAAAGNFEQTAYKSRFPAVRHEERLREMKKLTNDVQLRDLEIKNLQECVTSLLREKSNLQNKVQSQVEEYQGKLALLKRKYDSSLSAFRKRHNENVERLQARFQDIMRIERSPFDAEGWLQSLNSKELAELNNRIDILSSRAAANGESDIIHAEATSRRARRNNNSAERKPHNKFSLRKERAREGRVTSLSGGANKRGSAVKISGAKSNGKMVVEELYSRDSKHKRERRFLDNGEKKLRASRTEPAETKADQTLDWQREKFIYRSSVYHRLSNGR